VKFKFAKLTREFLIRILPKNVRRPLWRMYLRLKASWQERRKAEPADGT
jgi:hypothetical protein